MTKRVLLGGLVGAIVVFFVSSFFHMATQLGEMGVHSLPNEAVLSAAMQSSIPDAGFYFFPGMNTAPGQTSEQKRAEQRAMMEKYKTQPVGILIYTPPGRDFDVGKLLLNQFLFNLAAGLLLAWSMATVAAALSYRRRVLLAVAFVIFGGLVYTLPYWNWYRFPLEYILSDAASWIVSWTAAGLPMAAIVKRPSATIAGS
ncbi:MAG: hypothetical protein WA660_09370 [Candidatus Acidiferrales bacterium]